MANTNDHRIASNFLLCEVLEPARQDLSIERRPKLTDLYTQQFTQLRIIASHEILDLQGNGVTAPLQTHYHARSALLRRFDYLFDVLFLTRNRPFHKHILACADTWDDGLVMLVNSCVADYQIDVWVGSKILWRAISFCVIWKVERLDS